MGETQQAEKLFGTPVKRREDHQMITGDVEYLDDVQLPGMLHVAILRSPHAHAEIKNVDTSKAEELPGVVEVFTGEDFADVNPLPCAWQAGGVENNVNTPRMLEIDKVTHAGAGIAAVVAEDRYTARDALDHIDVDYEELPVVVDAEEATRPDAPQIHENAENNVCMDWHCGDEEDTKEALDDADVVASGRLRNQRLIPNAMEPRGAIGKYDPGKDKHTVWMTSQAPHVMRLLMCAFVFEIPENKMRTIAPRVGGGFGVKIFLYPEYPLVAAISKRLEQPVKWVETRSESYVASTHGRDHVTDIEVGAKEDGTITALNVDTYANLGGVLSTIAPGIPTTLYGRMLSGVYDIPNIHGRVRGVYTNTAMVDAYRGAGRPEATYTVERAVSMVARELDMDPAEVRRKNFISEEKFPYPVEILNGLEYDSGEYDKTLDSALDIVDYEDFRDKQREARDEGRYLGLGLSTYVEICGVAPSDWIGTDGEGWGAGLWESANVRVHLTGKTVVTLGTLPHGQGHETSAAQVVADELGIPYEDVEVEHGDSQGTPFGYGTYGSRSAAVGLVAVHNSLQRIKEKARKIGAHMLEAEPEDVVYEDGEVHVKGAPDQSQTIQEIAGAAAVAYDLPDGMEPFLDDTAYYDPPNCTFPFGAHVCMVEVDPDTGEIDLRRYVAVDDVGRVINPMIVDGQVHGGIAQGVGQAMWEGAQYDENGQLTTGSMMDYALPKAHNLPDYETDRTVTPSPVNPLGVKGAGETGTIAATPAVVNAVVDALEPLGVENLDMPLTPERVWNAIHNHKE